MHDRSRESVRPAACGACWACGSLETRPWSRGGAASPLRAEDLAITDARYGLTLPLAQCLACGFRFATGDELERLHELYAALDDPGYRESEEPRRLQMRALVTWARGSHPAPRRALDVGAASGLLVAEAARQGLEAVGVEPSRALAERARGDGLRVLCGALPHPALEGERFDLVFLVDVIEHVRDPVGLLRACADRLAPGGRLALVTPDASSVAARLLRRRWWHYRLAHVGYFDRRSLERALARAGLHSESWRRAGWFFSVRYLAERVERYLPVAWLNRRIARVPGFSGIYARVVPLNLYDSWAVIARAGDAA